MGDNEALGIVRNMRDQPTSVDGITKHTLVCIINRFTYIGQTSWTQTTAGLMYELGICCKGQRCTRTERKTMPTSKHTGARREVLPGSFHKSSSIGEAQMSVKYTY